MKKVTTEYKKRTITTFLESFLALNNSQSIRIDRSLATSILECFKTDAKEVLNEGAEERTVNRVISYPSYSEYHNRNDVKDNDVWRVICSTEMRNNGYYSCNKQGFKDIYYVLTQDLEILNIKPRVAGGDEYKNIIYSNQTLSFTYIYYSAKIYTFPDKKILVVDSNNNHTMYDISNIADLYMKCLVVDVQKEGFRELFKEGVEKMKKNVSFTTHESNIGDPGLRTIGFQALLNFNLSGLFNALT